MANTNLATSRPTSPIQQQDQFHGSKPLSVTDIYPRQAHNPASSMSLEQYRLQLYNYALNIERLRYPQYATGNGSTNSPLPTWLHPYNSHCAISGGNNRLATLSTISLFPQSQRIFQPEEPKPQHSYIGLIAMAILSSSEMKLVLSDIYQYILDNYAYFRTRGPGWRNSIRHNLSLNDCFIKSGRSANGKGHYWAIHPANMDDFRKGDFRRRKAQRKVRKHMGLSVDDASTDSPSPPPLDLTTPPLPPPNLAAAAIQQLSPLNYPYHQQYFGQFFGRNLPQQYTALQRDPSSHHHHQAQHHQHISYINSTTTTTIANLYSQTRKRQFDVASLLAPDVQIVDIVEDDEEAQTQHTVITKVQVKKHQQMIKVVEQHNTPTTTNNLLDIDPDADIDVDGDEDNVNEANANANAERIPEPISRDNNSYLSDKDGRSSFDADIDDQEPQNFLITVSPPLSSSQHDTNSLEECPQTVSAGPGLEGPEGTFISIPKTYVDLNGVNPQLLSRYYGTYMAAAARRANLEISSRANQQSKTMCTPPPPSMELLPNM